MTTYIVVGAICFIGLSFYVAVKVGKFFKRQDERVKELLDRERREQKMNQS